MTSQEQVNPAGNAATSTEGTALAPKFYEGPSVVHGDIRQHRRYYTYRIDSGKVAGYAVSVMFTIERPAKEVWPYFKDFNLWQNCRDHYYSGVAGDLDGKTLRLSMKPNDPGPHQYK